jgi:hypothetical protein
MDSSTIFPSVTAILLALALIAAQRSDGAKWLLETGGCDAESLAACGCAGVENVPGLVSPDFSPKMFLALTGCPIE